MNCDKKISDCQTNCQKRENILFASPLEILSIKIVNCTVKVIVLNHSGAPIQATRLFISLYSTVPTNFFESNMVLENKWIAPSDVTEFCMDFVNGDPGLYWVNAWVFDNIGKISKCTDYLHKSGCL